MSRLCFLTVYELLIFEVNVFNMSSSLQEAIFRVVAAILHLGNIEFSKGPEADSSQPKDEKSRFHLKTAAELFMCDCFFLISLNMYFDFSVLSLVNP